MRHDSESTKDFPFEQYALIETESLDRLKSAVSKEIGPHDFTALRNHQEFSTRVTCVRLSKTRLFGVRFGVHLHARTPPANALQIVLPMAGEVVKRGHDKGFKAGITEGLCLSPGEPVNVDWSPDCVAAIIWVDVHQLYALAHTVLGASFCFQAKFPDKITLSHGVGLSISNLTKTIILELSDEDTMFSRGLSTKSIEDALLLSVLHTVPGISKEKRFQWDGETALREVVDYIYAHIEDDISITDLTNISGVSLRKLQYDFARTFGMGPMTMIRREKLRRAREALEKHNPEEMTVAEIAAQWSFFDRRYFTRLYHKEFGELPSVTLQRTRKHY